MAIETKILRTRQGKEADFDVSKLLPGEFAVSLDKQKVRIGFGSGKTKELASVDDVNDKIAEFKNTVDGEIAEAVAEVEEAGQRVLATIPSDYTKTAQKADEAIRTKASAIVCAAEGESIAVSDSSGDYMRGLKIYGRTEQASTNGYQLFDASRLPTATMGGATVTNNGDGSFTVSGSGTLTEQFYLNYNLTHAETISLLKAGVATLKTESETTPYLLVRLVVDGATVIQITRSNKATILQEWLDNETSYLRFTFVGAAGKTIVAGTIKPMFCQDGDGTWEPYTGGAPSPSMEYPQELVNVGASGSVGVGVYSANLVDFGNITYIDNATIVDEKTNTVRMNINNSYYSQFYFENIHLESLKGKTLVLDADTDNQSGYMNSMLIQGKFSDGTNYKESYSDTGGTQVRLKIPNTLIETTGIEIRLCRKTTQHTNTTNVYKNVRLYIAEFHDGTFVKGNKQFLTLSTPNGLPAIPVTDAALATYTDASGTMWASDYIDEAAGEWVQRCYTKVFDGTENWYSANEYDIVYIMEIYRNALSSHFIYNSNPAIGDNDTANQYMANGEFAIRADTTDRTYFRNEYTATASDWKAKLAELYAAGTPVTVTYLLAEPIRHPLTQAEIAAFKALRTNYPHTTVLNDAGAWMEVEYNADTKTWLLNQISQLQAAIINSLT